VGEKFEKGENGGGGMWVGGFLKEELGGWGVGVTHFLIEVGCFETWRIG